MQDKLYASARAVVGFAFKLIDAFYEVAIFHKRRPCMSYNILL